MPAVSPSSVYYGLLAFCVLLGAGLLLLEWRRPNRQRLVPRLLAGVVAAVALWFTAYPPLRRLPAARAEAIVLTPGYSADTLQTLLRRLGRGTPVWRYGQVEGSSKARPLPSLLALAEQRPALRRVHVLGQGLSVAELPQLGRVTVVPHALPSFTGFRAAQWAAQMPLGEVLWLEGAVENTGAAGPAWVCLQAAGAVRDSVKLPTGRGRFRLRYRPKTAGLARYDLQLRQAGRTLATEPVPVEVTTPVLPAVLLLSATPSFEFKFLKNYLGEAHYAVGLRTTVSRGLVQTDFVNQPAASLGRLTPALLARYAVLVTDAASLAGLAAAETQAVQNAVREGRMGLVLLADGLTLPRNLPGRVDFALASRPTAAPPLRLTWADAPAPVTAPLALQLRSAPALRSLVSGPGPTLAAASRRLGLGAVVVSAVPETFRWGLQGKTALYASLWNRLLSAALPPAPASASWHLSTPWPRVYQPLTLQLEAAFPEASPEVQALVGGPAVRLPLRQDPRLPEWSSTQFWPGTAGWHQVRGPGRATHRFYVYPAQAWQGPEQLAWAQATALQPRAAATAQASAFVSQPWPAAWFFGLFLVAAGFLWLEEKL